MGRMMRRCARLLRGAYCVRVCGCLCGGGCAPACMPTAAACLHPNLCAPMHLGEESCCLHAYVQRMHVYVRDHVCTCACWRRYGSCGAGGIAPAVFCPPSAMQPPSKLQHHLQSADSRADPPRRASAAGGASVGVPAGGVEEVMEEARLCARLRKWLQPSSAYPHDTQVQSTPQS